MLFRSSPFLLVHSLLVQGPQAALHSRHVTRSIAIARSPSLCVCPVLTSSPSLTTEKTDFVFWPLLPTAADATHESRGRSDETGLAPGSNPSSRPNSRPNSRPGSRSGSRVREILHSVTHLSSGQDWGTQRSVPFPSLQGSRLAAEEYDENSFGHANIGHADPPRSRETSPHRPQGSSSRSSSRARGLGPGYDWAKAANTPSPVGSPAPVDESSERQGRHASPHAHHKDGEAHDRSRSGSRIREALHKLGHRGAGEDWAAKSLSGSSTPPTAESVHKQAMEPNMNF